MNDESRRYQREQNAFRQQAAIDHTKAGAPTSEPMKDRLYTTQELDAMERQIAVDQGMAPSAAQDASQELQGGKGFMGGFTGALERTGLGIRQMGTYLTGDDAAKEQINQEIRRHEDAMKELGPSGAIGDMAGTAAQFAGPQSMAAAGAKLVPPALIRGARYVFGKPGSVLRSAEIGAGYEGTQPVTPSDESTGEFLISKGGRMSAGAAAGATLGVAGKYATREGVATPPDRQAMITQAKRLNLYKYLTPEQKTGSTIFGELELGGRSNAGSAGLYIKRDLGLQASLNKAGAESIGSTAAAPTDHVLAEQWKIAQKGYAPVASIPKMSWDSQYIEELDKLAFKQMQRVGGSTDVSGVIGRLKKGAGKLTGDDFLQELQTVRDMGFDARRNGQSATSAQLKSLEKIMDDFADRRVAVLAKKGTLPADAMDQLRTARTEMSKIHAIENAVDPTTGELSADRYMKGAFKRSPAHAGPGQSPTAKGLADVTETARLIRQVSPNLSNMGTLMTGRQVNKTVTGGPVQASSNVGSMLKNWLVHKYHLGYGGDPGLLSKTLTPEQNMMIRRMLPGMAFAGQEGATE